MPLLGFGEGEWSLFQYAPGMSYLITQSNGDPATAGRYLQLINEGADLGPGAFSWDADETATVGGRRVEMGIQTTDSGLGDVTTTEAVWWDAGNGWTATVTTGLAAQGDVDRDGLLAAAAAVTEVPLDIWEQRFATSSPPPRPLAEPMLVLDDESGGTQVIAISGSSVTAWLTLSVDDLPDVILLALPPTIEQAYLEQSDTGVPIDVRGTNAYFSSAGDGSPRARLVWTEGGQSYEISAAAGSTSEQLSAIAELLVFPGGETWQQLVFPDEPRDFPDDAVFRVDPSVPSGS